MYRTTTILNINSLDQVPDVEVIRAQSRDVVLRLEFSAAVESQREAEGERLKSELEGFLVAVHTIDPEINIYPLITSEEIEAHADFFERCARDYRALATKLIFWLAERFGITMDPQFPMATFHSFKNNSKNAGRFEDWLYNFHGAHCGFEHRKTGQKIEVPLIYGHEFGILDPYFFGNFIVTTTQYQPLPVAIYDEYWDGKRIIERMLQLGRFKKISSELDGGGVVVVNHLV